VTTNPCLEPARPECHTHIPPIQHSPRTSYTGNTWKAWSYKHDEGRVMCVIHKCDICTSTTTLNYVNNHYTHASKFLCIPVGSICGEVHIDEVMAVQHWQWWRLATAEELPCKAITLYSHRCQWCMWKRTHNTYIPCSDSGKCATFPCKMLTRYKSLMCLT